MESSAIKLQPPAMEEPDSTSHETLTPAQLSNDGSSADMLLTDAALIPSPSEVTMMPPPSSLISQRRLLVANQPSVERNGDAASLSSKEARLAVASAAAAAAAKVAPGQRDRAIATATTQAIAQQQRLQERRQRNPSSSNEAGGSSGQASGSQATHAKLAGDTPSLASYEPPSWGGVPEGAAYTLEVLKAGSVIGRHSVSAKAFYTLGRGQTCDFVLEHPSASRLHAVLQYNAETREAFIYDAGSSHGTFLNKERIKCKVYVPLMVGHTLKFGTSTRLYLFDGPQELMPAEGLNKEQRRQLRALEFSRKMQEKDAETAQMQMAVAISGASAGASWGLMGEDAESDLSAAKAGTVDWRSYAARHPLNDKQSKISEKIRSREYKIANLRKECDRIVAKEKDGELTGGQASTLVRNERAIEKLAEEVEDLEDEVQESVSATISGRAKEQSKKADMAEGAEGKATRKRVGTGVDDYGDAGSSDSGDEFYDRAKSGAFSAPSGSSRKKSKDAIRVVETAEGLYGKREALREEQRRLSELITAEEKRLGLPLSTSTPQSNTPHSATAASQSAGNKASQPEPSTSVPTPSPCMPATDITMLETCTASPSAAASTAAAAAAATTRPESQAAPGDQVMDSGPDANTAAAQQQPSPQLQLENHAANSARDSSNGGSCSSLPAAAVSISQEAGVDSLDAFMFGMAAQEVDDHLAALRKELFDTDSQLARAEKLLLIADPDGWMQPHSVAARQAKAAAQQAILLARQKRAAEVVALKRKVQQDQQAFTAEVEDEDGLVSEVTDALLLDAAASNQSPLLPGSMTASQPSATKGATHRSIHRIEAEDPSIQGGLQLQRPKPAPSSVAHKVALSQTASTQSAQKSQASIQAAQHVADLSSGAAPSTTMNSNLSMGPPGSSVKRNPGKQTQSVALSTGGSRGAAQKQGTDASASADLAAVKVAAGLALRAAADAGAAERAAAAAQEEAEAKTAATWQPPSGQRGDGRTSLNDKFGY